MKWLARLEGRGTFFWLLASLAAMVLVGLVDYWTGWEVSVLLLYLFPISIVSWFAGRWPGVAVSFLAAAVCLAADLLVDHFYSSVLIAVWNALIRLGFFVTVAVLLPSLRELERERELSRFDHLTGAVSRRYLLDALQRELARMRRYGHPFTLAYIDLDNFKEVNDRFGHSVGDEVLRAVSESAQSHMRKSDFFARLGGDEFLILLPETDQPGAQLVISRLLPLLTAEMSRGGWPITFSIGVVTFLEPPTTVDESIRRADDLMYATKRGGKDGVRFAVTPETA